MLRVLLLYHSFSVALVVVEVLEVRIVSEGIVARVLAEARGSVVLVSEGVPGVVHHLRGPVAEGDLVLVATDTDGRLSVGEKVLGGVLVEGAEVSAEQLGRVGLVKAAGPDGGWRGERVVELV